MLTNQKPTITVMNNSMISSAERLAELARPSPQNRQLQWCTMYRQQIAHQQLAHFPESDIYVIGVSDSVTELILQRLTEVSTPAGGQSHIYGKMVEAC